MAKVTQSFQAEIQQLLDLMIHSLYSQKEIFLRELISNASDAIDKVKFLSLTQHDLVPNQTEFKIRLESDSQAKTLKVIDNGIGMNREEVVKNLGTIAHSGTKAFLSQMKDAKNNPELIGQFGVGFYSAFMVADKVTVHTQKAGENSGVLWESEGNGNYSIDEVPRAGGFGTTITLHLKDTIQDEDHMDFTDQWNLKSLVKKYSDFIAYPVVMKTEKKIPVADKPEEFTSEWNDEVLNSQKALWLKNSSEIKEEEYKEFYRHITHDWNDPAKTIHYKAEGTMEYSALMYIPSQRPWNYFYRDSEYGLKLYIRRVFIMDDSKDLLPPYLRFVKGLVDSNDLSLNVSREMLQQDRQVTAIRKSLTAKILNTFKEMLTKDREGYENFWSQFGATLKEGVSVEPQNKEKIAECSLFHSSISDKMTTLEEYVARMKPEQKHIYFITGDSLAQVKNSPYLEKLNEKEFEVLFMIDPVDEWVTDAIKEFKGKQLQSVVRENLDLDTEEQKNAKAEEFKNFETQYKDLMTTIKTSLSEKIRDVKLSDRLTQTPACLVSGSNDPSAHMEKILSQISKDSAGPKAKRILEINPRHPLFAKMSKADSDAQSQWAEILYSQALLNEGSQLEDPVKFSKQITDLMLAQQNS
jgi:molecular chaperone HtpG